MQKWDIQVVQQRHAREALVPTQPNDPSNYNRMYVIVAQPCGSTAVCCPIQNSLTGIGITEVELKKGYTTCITKDCKIICHEIFTLPLNFFAKKVGFIKPPEQDQIQTALIAVFDL